MVPRRTTRTSANLKFKDGQIDEAEANFDKAIDYFKEADNKASLLQLFLTVARMELDH